MLIHHPDAARHLNAPGHVESPQRIEAIIRKLSALHLFEDVLVADPATRSDAETTHTSAYLDMLQAFGEGYLDVDTALHTDTISRALSAAGVTLAAAQYSSSQARPSFALARPPGHHAGPDYGGGFCYLNNVAIAANRIRSDRRRIAIVDVDAHHGNGTSDVFASRPDVLYLSVHQANLYPGTGPAEFIGEGPGRGFTVNVPLPPRSGDGSYAFALDTLIEPILRQFAPDVLLVSFGVDAHYRDPLTGLVLSSDGYVDLANRLIRIAGSVAGGRVAFTLEGGYHLAALAEVVAGVVAAFRGESIHLQFREDSDPRARGRDAVARAVSALAPHWDL